MKFVTLTPTSSAASALETEIMFSVASARAQEIDFLRIDLLGERAAGIRSAAAKILRSLKKQGRIQLFVDARELCGSSTEAQYLTNKYPDILDLFEKDTDALIVKI